MAGQGGGATITTKGPTIELNRTLVHVRDISVREGESGWRAQNPERVSEIKQSLCTNGTKMTVLGGVTLLSDIKDCEGKHLIDDGLSSILAWREVDTLYESNPQECPLTSSPWHPDVLKTLSNGLVCSWAIYEDSDREIREAWNAAKHDDENNKFAPTSIYIKINLVIKRYNRFNSYPAVTADLVSIYGQPKYSTVQRWVHTTAQR